MFLPLGREGPEGDFRGLGVEEAVAVVGVAGEVESGGGLGRGGTRWLGAWRSG